MKTAHRAYPRALITTAATGAAMTLALLSGAGPASAHVHVDAAGAGPGSTSVLTFRVPGESEKGALTTKFSVDLPNVASARTEVMPGWTATLDRDTAAGTVRTVTWTAAPSVGISSDQFALFNVSVTLPNQPSVDLPATQTYSDGTVVRWDQPPLPGGGEPEHPVPTLKLTGAPGGRRRRHGDLPRHRRPRSPPRRPRPLVPTTLRAGWRVGRWCSPRSPPSWPSRDAAGHDPSVGGDGTRRDGPLGSRPGGCCHGIRARRPRGRRSVAGQFRRCGTDPGRRDVQRTVADGLRRHDRRRSRRQPVVDGTRADPGRRRQRRRCCRWDRRGPTPSTTASPPPTDTSSMARGPSC